MTEKNQGQIIPFRLSSVRMRRSAEQHRMSRDPLETLVLLRRAAEQDNATSGWHQLAGEMRRLGCWEASAALLSRVLSREDHAPGAWLDMARCQAAMGQRALAADCLYHQLQEDPWSPEGDAARMMLAETEEPDAPGEPRRVPLMVQRGIQAWNTGDRAQGIKRLNRALRLCADRERLLITMALMHMLQWDYQGALRRLARVLRDNPQSARGLCTLSAVLQQMGKPRMARAFLRRALPLCDDARLEEPFLTSAWALDAWPEMEKYLQKRMRTLPYRTALLNARATMCFEQGRREEAHQLWRTVLSIDPADRRALAMLAWTNMHPNAALPAPGRYPRGLMAAQLEALLRAKQSGVPMAQLLAYGSRERTVLDYLMTSLDAVEQVQALNLLRTEDNCPEAAAYLRESLAWPALSMDMRRQVLLRLAEMGSTDPMLMLVPDRYMVAQCQQTKPVAPGRSFRRFLPMLLRDTACRNQCAQIAEYAAEMWRHMSPAQREEAAGSGCLMWCRAMEAMWLCHGGREADAARAVLTAPVSPRRISRVMRQLSRLTIP